jgi:protein SCO1/2
MTAASAQMRIIEAPPQTEYVQRLGEQLPLALSFADSDGRRLPLQALFGAVPVVLVLGYYQCQQLCSSVMEGVLQGLVASGLPRAAYRIVAISIDPRETPQLAARKRASYLAQAPHGAAPDLHLLTGDARATSQIARAAGFAYVEDRVPTADGSVNYAHPAGIVIASPDGRISRYLLGVSFAPRDLRLALNDASQGKTGNLADRLLLLCSHFDPVAGRYNLAVMTGLRAFAVLSFMVIGLMWWRRRAMSRSRAQ